MSKSETTAAKCENCGTLDGVSDHRDDRGEEPVMLCHPCAEAIAADQVPDLVPYGYAPGNYSIYCADCQLAVTADKRAIRCFSCALEAANV
jgi:hypothetical protein